ncbi:MAG: hypothetical protein KJ950_16925 [Proteobacteria bacterium]|nr:hypothetical protein [Pseudomonadota bacterium]MBU1688166.1 hypothetical protein [Pseudomonadota bacterium]
MCKRGFAVVLLIVTLLLPTLCPADSEKAGAEMIEEVLPVAFAPEEPSNIFTSLHQVVDLTSQEAFVRFRDFFGKSQVSLRPFYLQDAYYNEQVSQLGAVLADQVGAIISNGAVARTNNIKKEDHPQWIRGNLQELDGYLRIQIIGSNYLGEQRSCVVNFEMSEALYRALHTKIASFAR